MYVREQRLGHSVDILKDQRGEPRWIMSINTNSNDEITGDVYSKVPAVTVFFWIIKVLCTTVGETASDFLNVNLGLGLKGTSIAAGAVLLTALVFQFRATKYTPAIYW